MAGRRPSEAYLGMTPHEGQKDNSGSWFISSCLFILFINIYNLKYFTNHMIKVGGGGVVVVVCFLILNLLCNSFSHLPVY